MYHPNAQCACHGSEALEKLHKHNWSKGVCILRNYLVKAGCSQATAQQMSGYSDVNNLGYT